MIPSIRVSVSCPKMNYSPAGSASSAVPKLQNVPYINKSGKTYILLPKIYECRDLNLLGT